MNKRKSTNYALVTGANKGIGYSITEELLKRKYNVIAVSKTIDNLLTLKKLYFDNLIIIECDLQSQNDIDNLFTYIDKNNYIVETLINNAGIGKFDNVEEISIEDWLKIINLNLNVPFILIRHFLPYMKLNNYGKIINIGSNADSLPEKYGAAYCASKYGLLGLSQCTRLETKGYNITITTISPGRVDTYFNAKSPGCRPTALQPIDIADLVVYIIETNGRCNIEQIKVGSILE